MNVSKMIETLKGMGLSKIEREKCIETYRDVGEAETLEQARGYVAAKERQLADAKSAAKTLCGISL